MPLSRRQFLCLSAAAAGCGRRPPETADMTTEQPFTPSEAGRAADLQAELDRIRRVPARDHVAAGARRTVPVRPLDLPATVPGLRPLGRPTVLLHPRASDPPGPAEGSIGGPLAWPADEAWPTCDRHRAPYVPVAQVLAAEVPGVAFRPGADRLQVLWCPRDHGWVAPTFRWRAGAGLPAAAPPAPAHPFPGLVPRPCRLFPETVTDYPRWADLPAAVRAVVPATLTAAQQAAVSAANPNLARTEFESAEAVYEYAFEPTHTGPKVGGWPAWVQSPEWPDCQACGRRTDFLMQLCGGDGPFLPVQESHLTAGGDTDLAYRNAVNAPGLLLPGDGTIYLFVCRHCPDWPVTHVEQT